MQPSQKLIVVSSSWPFTKWGINFIGPFSKGNGSASYAIIDIDYFIKWIEAKPLIKITEANTSKFIWKNIICQFKILHSLVSDNGRHDPFLHGLQYISHEFGWDNLTSPLTLQLGINWWDTTVRVGFPWRNERLLLNKAGLLPTKND